MNLLRKFIKTSPTDEIASIPAGKFFLARSPLLPKGALECLFNDCVLSMKRTTKPFCYQLAVTRAYQEGESSSQSTGEFEDGDEDENSAEKISRSDERLFFLTEDLKVQLITKNNGSQIIHWRDVNGDVGENWEFAVDEEIKYADVDSFMRALYGCLYEQKYGKSCEGVPEKALAAEFGNHKKAAGGQKQASMDVLRQLKSIGDAEKGTRSRSAVSKPKAEKGGKPAVPEPASDDENDTFGDASSIPFFIFKPSVQVEGDVVDKFKVQLRYYDLQSDTFVLLNAGVEINIAKALNYSLVCTTPKFAFSVLIAQPLNGVFNKENLAFIFNYYSADEKGDSTSYSLLFQFSAIDDFYKFSHHFQDALVKSLNPKVKSNDPDMEFLTSTVQNMDLGTDESENEPEDQEAEGLEAILDEVIRNHGAPKKTREPKLFVSSDSDDDDDEDTAKRNERQFMSLAGLNSGLSVGNANNRSYVTKGDSIAVYSHGEGNLNFLTTIDKLKDLNGKEFKSGRMMLHQRDNALLMTRNDPSDTNMYKVDLARGAIVEAYDVSDKGPLTSFSHKSKFASLTDEQVYLGTTANSLFHVDPRLSGSKIVAGDSYKTYKTKTMFGSMAVTDKGWAVVFLKDGTIRLFERFGKKATVALPSIGEELFGGDVTKDGRWVIAVCAGLLLLIDTRIGEGQKNAGEIGFKKYFDADKKPVPKRLTLEPRDVSLITQVTGRANITFKDAKFDTTLTGEETHIIASTGPFSISWSLKDATKHWAKFTKYKLIRFSQDVVMENYSFHSQDDIYAALQNGVVSTNTKALKVANKRSIMDQ